MNHIRILDKDGGLVADNLLNECNQCYQQCDIGGKGINDCPKYGGARKLGKIENKSSSTFLCCNVTKNMKLFKSKLEALSYAYNDLIIPKREIEESVRKAEQQKVNRLVHNLTSINAHNIQEIYDMVPQHVLTSHWKNQLDFIEKEIKEKSRTAAMTFLRIAKNNIHMKSEFSIYRKLDRKDSSNLEFHNYPIRNVLLNVLHTFFTDFSNNGIYVNVQEFLGKVKIDYETIQVAIYHLIENAAKYTKPNSKIVIDFQETKNDISVRFFMTSLHIKAHERLLIFNEGYSGELSKVAQKNGDGIGMWRIKQMMELNGGSCSVECGETIEKVMGFDFAENIFILKFKK
jgi:light-regulated signal transduction histidine kinase (bacteriophytochrome)